MITLKKATVHKYKCIENDQSFEIDPDVTILVGMNESGKTSILEALAKTNYFVDDPKFKLNSTHDYPRKEKKKMEKSGEKAPAITCEFTIEDELLKKISMDVGQDVFKIKTFSRTNFYSDKPSVSGIIADAKKFVEAQTSLHGVSSNTLNEKLLKVKSKADLSALKEEYKEEKILAAIGALEKYFLNKWEWSDFLSEYIYRVHIDPNMPKFLYYDEYYALPSRISIEDLQKSDLREEELKTAKALFELAEIETSELIKSNDFEDFQAELEATQAIITNELFEYWSTNSNLGIEFKIDKVEKTDQHNNTRIVEHVLDIRVKNQKKGVSLPLKNRSKGFNWFFSFLVWFKKIQEDNKSNYIILLDEPGLNLHAAAQADLLNFIEHLSDEYQILYTTHSPFMVAPKQLHRVRTVVETDDGSIVSDSIQEKDPKTLFPLQAALGYDIAQNLFISQNNLLVEGVSDLIYLQVMSGLLQQEGREGLSDKITIVPVGGMEKVATFVSLLRGSNLGIACLLDSSIDNASKSKLDNMIKEKIIHLKNILFFDQFVDANEADIEDLFSKDDYLKIFNASFSEYKDIAASDLKAEIARIVLQINHHLGIDRYNHYRPANFLTRQGVDSKTFSKETLDRFEAAFREVNKIFGGEAIKKAA
jgi:predicted ATPase